MANPQKSKIVEIPSGATITQMENSLNNFLKIGWTLSKVFQLGTRVYAIFVKKE